MDGVWCSYQKKKKNSMRINKARREPQGLPAGNRFSNDEEGLISAKRDAIGELQP